jgi:hypothetical protein
MDGWMNGWMNGWTDGWMDGWTDGWVDGWMDGWTDGRTDVRAASPELLDRICSYAAHRSMSFIRRCPRNTNILSNFSFLILDSRYDPLDGGSA